MTSSQAILLSLIRAVVSGAQDVSRMMDACGSKAAYESWAKVMEDAKGSTLQVLCFKTRRFFANRWKRELVFREGIWSQLWYGGIAHLQRLETINKGLCSAMAIK